MKLFASLLVGFALLSFVGVAQAAKRDKALNGTVGSVAQDNKSVTVKVKDKATNETKEVVVAVDDKTTYTLDGKDAKIGDLKAGQKVKVSPATGTATSIDATSPKSKKNK